MGGWGGEVGVVGSRGKRCVKERKLVGPMILLGFRSREAGKGAVRETGIERRLRGLRRERCSLVAYLGLGEETWLTFRLCGRGHCRRIGCAEKRSEAWRECSKGAWRGGSGLKREKWSEHWKRAW